MAELQISWLTASRVSTEEPRRAVVTGDGAEAARQPSVKDKGPSLIWNDRPLLVYVCDLGGQDAGFDKVEEVTLKNEKIALGLRAFRCIRVSPGDAEADELLASHGSSVPRMLLISPSGGSVRVLERGRLKSGPLFAAMKLVANAAYERDFEKTVKSHLQLLADQDKVSGATDVARAKLERLSAKERPSKAKVESAKRTLAELERQWQEVRTALRQVWSTPSQGMVGPRPGSHAEAR